MSITVNIINIERSKARSLYSHYFDARISISCTLLLRMQNANGMRTYRENINPLVQ